MFKKLMFAIGLIALPLMLSQQQASAQGFSIGFGSPGYGYSVGRVGVPISPYYSSAYRGHGHGHGHHVTPYPSYRHSSGYRGHGVPVYRSGYGGYGGGYCPPRGYRAPYYGGSGISFRIGF